MSFFTVRLDGDDVLLLDQRLLPEEERYLRLASGEEVARAIEEMAVRGAPAIGVTAAMGVAIELARASDAGLAEALARVSDRLARTRPTAVNLAWALARMRAKLEPLLASRSPGEVRAQARAEAQRIADEDVAACRALGDAGAALLPPGARVLTHCNAGALATAGYGTALGVVRSAARLGCLSHVVAQETRPFLQGARLTAWELARDGIPVRLITDSMGGALMAQQAIDVVIVGADRIAANGDVANKIGTYSTALLARAHGLPFYVAAPFSSVDLSLASGREIPIEQRSAAEVTTIAGRRIAPEGVLALHPAFDVTPAEFVTAIITERGVIRPPLAEGLAAQRRAEPGR
ncbi:MAG TPA: S-methyl-5-thioribose-1-phosphate isomerase [Myxococcota bacterium]|nr:S-methyl-5-thioribose-1-phosphate isomerase [Myxococcota bacterium]